MNEMRADAGIETTTAGEELSLLLALMHDGRLAEGRLDAALAPAGLSLAKWTALRPLVEGGEPLPLSQLAAALACVKSNVTQMLDRLEADGLARRIVQQRPADRRGVLAEATAEGRRRFFAGSALLGAAARELLAAYTPAERTRLAQLLARLINERA
jgi:DNA-binding MarR family transcriptional regulator